MIDARRSNDIPPTAVPASRLTMHTIQHLPPIICVDVARPTVVVLHFWLAAAGQIAVNIALSADTALNPTIAGVRLGLKKINIRKLELNYAQKLSLQYII